MGSSPNYLYKMGFRTASLLPVLIPLISGQNIFLKQSQEVSNFGSETSCKCNGIFYPYGKGECSSTINGKQFCHVDPGQCEDETLNKWDSSLIYSFKACIGSKVKPDLFVRKSDMEKFRENNKGNNVYVNAALGNFIDMQKNIANGGDINKVGSNQYLPWVKESPLAAAIEGDHTEVALYLISKGANTSIPGGNLRRVAYESAKKGNVNILRALEKAGANLQTSGLPYNWAPIAGAAEEGQDRAVTFLINQKVDVDYVFNGGECAVCEAVLNGHKQILESLHRAGANLNLTNCKRGKQISLLDLSVDKGYTQVAKYLIENNEGLDSSSLEQAVKLGNLEVIKAWTNAGVNLDVYSFFDDFIPRRLLHTAARYARLDVAKYLTERGLDINERNVDGITPLYEARNRGHKNVVHWMLQAGAMF